MWSDFGAFLWKTLMCTHSLPSQCKIPVKGGSSNLQANRFWLRAKYRCKTDDELTRFMLMIFEIQFLTRLYGFKTLYLCVFKQSW